MIPLLLISKTEQNINKYIADFIEEYKFPQYAIFKVYPEKSELTIRQIRSIRKQLVTSLQVNRLFLIFSFDQATVEAQNAFLKTLEDKVQTNQFVLVAHYEAKILPTVCSRAKIIYLDKNEHHPSVDKNMAVFLDTVIKAQDYKYLANQMIAGLPREQAVNFLDQAILYLRQRYSDRTIDIPRIIKNAFELKKLIENNNLNPQLAIDHFLLNCAP